jgi:G3E family GTPase
MQSSQHIPVTVLTGFLGSGKTTLLKRILTEQHGHRIAVIENEFGEEGVDNELLLQDQQEQIVEMNNGCIRKKAGEVQFERVIIETTGLADPGPVAQTFFIDDDIADAYLLDAVITVVDAKHAMTQLDQSKEIREQVAFADRLLLSKVDLIDEDALQALKTRLLRINPRAPMSEVHFGQTDIKQILDIRGFNLNAILEIDPQFLETDEHDHDEDVSSFVFRSNKPFDAGKLEDFLSGLIQVYGQDMLRYKGVLYMKGSDRQTVFQGVHQMMGADQGRKWQAGEKPSNKMVFIGRKLPKDLFMKGLQQCLA